MTSELIKGLSRGVDFITFFNSNLSECPLKPACLHVASDNNKIPKRMIKVCLLIHCLPPTLNQGLPVRTLCSYAILPKLGWLLLLYLVCVLCQSALSN